MNVIFFRRQQNNFRYRKYNYGIELDFQHTPGFQGLQTGRQPIFHFCIIHVWVILPRKQILRKTSKLSCYFYILQKHIRYTNIQLLSSYEVDIESCQPGSGCFHGRKTTSRGLTTCCSPHIQTINLGDFTQLVNVHYL